MGTQDRGEMSVTARGSPLCTRLTEEKRVSGFYFLHRSPFPLIFTNFKENLFSPC